MCILYIGPLNYINFQLQSEKKELTFGWLKNDDLIQQANFDNDDVAAAEFVVVVVSGENGCGNAVVVVAEKKIREIEILHIFKIQISVGQNKTPRNQMSKSILGHFVNKYFP